MYLVRSSHWIANLGKYSCVTGCLVPLWMHSYCSSIPIKHELFWWTLVVLLFWNLGNDKSSWRKSIALATEALSVGASRLTYICVFSNECVSFSTCLQEGNHLFLGHYEGNECIAIKCVSDYHFLHGILFCNCPASFSLVLSCVRCSSYN